MENLLLAKVEKNKWKAFQILLQIGFLIDLLGKVNVQIPRPYFESH